ncbi:small nuclear ribonucleoprotein Sm D3 [Desarmillaria ectypa]|nr:small nuclear ribonucleoprotein Sm D3 [Desarmillaria ectypa]
MATSGLGVPVKLLHESLGHIITVELKTGQLYRGKLAEAEDNLNISLKEITVTARDGRVSQLDQVYIRGSMIRFFIVPDMLQNAPMFKRVGPNAMRGRGIGTARGRATIMRGTYFFYPVIGVMLNHTISSSEWYVCHDSPKDLLLTSSFFAARRGRGVAPTASRGIRR